MNAATNAVENTGVSVVVPTLNEAENIDAIAQALGALESVADLRSAYPRTHRPIWEGRLRCVSSESLALP
jgi:hypothetical protein